MEMTPNPSLWDEIRKFARELYDEFDLGIQAQEKLQDFIHADPILREKAVAVFAMDLLRQAQREVRSRINGGTSKESTSPHRPRIYTDEEKQRVKVVCAKYSFLNWPMMDGTQLGAATLSLLKKNADAYEKQARGMARNAEFLRLIQNDPRWNRNKGALVAELFSEKELAGLMEKAKTSMKPRRPAR